MIDRISIVGSISGMKSTFAISFVFLFNLLIPTVDAGDGKKHLFILSGQSNMAGHKPDEAFIPAVEEAFGKESVIVVQDALEDSPSSAGTGNGKTLRAPLPKQPVIFTIGS